MKKALRIIIPILLTVAIVLCAAWYLLVYDRPFTRDVLLSFARQSESNGDHGLAAWFYGMAYKQSGNSDSVAIELAEQYKSIGNYTKAEFTLTNAIADGGEVELYIALCKTFVEQDKLLDAVKLLDNVTDPAVRDKLAELRPKTPAISPAPGFYNQYIAVEIATGDDIVYANQNALYPSVKNDQYESPFILHDGENTIYALAVSDSGLVSPLLVSGYTVGGVVKEMEFADKAIEAVVRELLSVADDTVLYTNDLWKIKNFEVPANAKKLTDLQYMCFLESLAIDGCGDGDYSFLSSITTLTNLSVANTPVSQEALEQIANVSTLRSLTLDNCNLSGIKPLEKATELTTLDLSNNALRALDSLSVLNKLESLNLSHNAVANLNMLSNLKYLTRLDVSYNALSTLAQISSLSQLKELYADYNSISDLGSFENLARLTHLSLEKNQLSDISTIANCTQLTELNIASNAITDIAALGALNQVTHFNFSYNQVKKLPEFSTDCALITIDGSHNLLSSLDNLSGLENLNSINMDYNSKISSVKALANCPLLVEVNIYGTKVKDVTMLTEQSIVVNYKPV